ncbi:ABC-2 type transport system ATP-binding protein [Salimicrobium flavidum]|uniref:ABC-2 type transport system ATP-binding protein n=2 Tax=Salimicrobium flavidum TaxID=570947 RepID=A0A1N7JED1_9BACI|nr:ABC-2 type transport system ATP-binding protein [Salimicrobium flavidum]
MPHVSFSYEKDYSEETATVTSLIKTAEKYRPYFDLNYAEELMDRFNLPRKRPMKKLSKGMQSMVTVIIGLASRAPISIFDESYSGMDAPAREIFYEEIIKEYETHPRTFILSTHLVSEMDHLFEDVIFLHEGRIMIHESMESITEKAVFVHGRKENVLAWSNDKKVLDQKSFGPTLTALLLHAPSREERKQAEQSGLDISPASLQDLFIHMTKEENAHVE